MTQDIETLRAWIRVVQFIACICATAFPIFYAFSRWYASWLGRLLMLQGVALAAALDASLIFQFMRDNPNVMLRFVVYALVLTLIAIATAALTFMVVRMNYHRYLQHIRFGKKGALERYLKYLRFRKKGSP